MRGPKGPPALPPVRRDANGSRASAEGVALVIDSRNDPEALGIPWHVKHTW
ncbi:MAG TPA: hypothetical protein VEP67_08485 [Thiobacillaceae bacterium]|nr:hypothetical protein [Thiobacillaceae bacterium]